jgi:hypothetical protein
MVSLGVLVPNQVAMDFKSAKVASLILTTGIICLSKAIGD